MLAAEAAYCELEQELQYELDHYEALHPGYDEYRFDLDEIEHDPYVLISILTAFHEGVFTIGEVQEELQMLFEKQYILTQTVEVEVRYRTETRTDSEGNDYDVEVPYNYYICKVKLENFDLSHVPVYIMDEETLSLYAVYMATLGNREDLFPGSGYVDKYTKPPTTYDIPPSALEDETFAALITEAEKYIGYPYVWGGSNPNTSFDCSGFVSWVLTQSGVCNTGRLGAQGLYNISTPGILCQRKTRRPDLFRRHLRYTGRFPCGYLCGRRKNAALRRPHSVCRYQHKLLAIPLLRFRATALQLKNDMEVI